MMILLTRSCLGTGEGSTGLLIKTLFSGGKQEEFPHIVSPPSPRVTYIPSPSVLPVLAAVDTVTMTTDGCCHLPGSLCDCAGTAGVWKIVEEAGGEGCQALYVTQVTALDGRLLSSVLKPISVQSDGPICRICHEGGSSEGLLSPCDCMGTLGTVHKSCLEKWLSSSNTSYCELCHTEFSIERRPRPLTEWLQDPGPRNEKRTLFCDMVCFLFITPLAAISGWLCLRGAQDHLHMGSWLQAVGLIALTIALFTIYVLWTLVNMPSDTVSFAKSYPGNPGNSLTRIYIYRYLSATTVSSTPSGEEQIRKYAF
ncbi:E3 ubiquitin-protein ligase marchf2 [Goodea atripinnis]|uniref:E3 ubiquitin-protein ligase MARCHF2 n=1 Tax=Goodea atripinnis TaxID=208336 RepID=A0ABV0P2A3_9TELE